MDREAGGGPWRYRVTSSNERGAGAPAQADEQSLPADLTATTLSDRKWESATIGWGSLGHDRSVSGGPISLACVEYAKGIGTHANSEIVYRLDPADQRIATAISGGAVTSGGLPAWARTSSGPCGVGTAAWAHSRPPSCGATVTAVIPGAVGRTPSSDAT
jgi:hypothetical protein